MEAARTIPGRENGGNCDIKNLSRGSKIYLPVFVDGANLSTGDMHFSQGDGEVTFCGAIEMSGFLDLKYIFYFISWHSIHTLDSRHHASILHDAYYFTTSACFLKLLRRLKMEELAFLSGSVRHLRKISHQTSWVLANV